jgi:hypothetical protein
VGNSLGVKIDIADLDYSYRVNGRFTSNSNNPPAIRVRFTRSNLVREILEAHRVKRKISTADIGWRDPPNYSIYVNESLEI